jgi:restriction system protein
MSDSARRLSESEIDGLIAAHGLDIPEGQASRDGVPVPEPQPPAPQAHQQYRSIFALRREWGSRSTPQLEDLALWREAIASAPQHRLAARLTKRREYPVPAPTSQAFPRFRKPAAPAIEPRQRPELRPLRLKWYAYLTFWWIPEVKRNHERANAAKQREFERWTEERERTIVRAQEEAAAARDAWGSRKALYEAACVRVEQAWEDAHAAWKRGYDSDASTLADLRHGYEMGKSDGVQKFFDVHLRAIPKPSWLSTTNKLVFDEVERILLVECSLPYFEKAGRIEKRKPDGKPGVATKSEAEKFASEVQYTTALGAMWEIAQLDDKERINLVCCNGSVTFVDPATGRERTDVILSVAARPSELREIVLERVSPEECFRELRGVAAPKLSDIVPIKPLIQMNTADRRFIADRDVLDGLAERNLATMDWQEFEHLVRELFEKVWSKDGTKVRITQASRDKGVDAVAFDPDPLRGGKIIIQAKRYTTTVELSAVRDLYGTIQAEGANKGILVTTSNFGPDAYEFAKDKPITLLNGANLLHYLKQLGYHAKIDLQEARDLLKAKASPKR